MKIKFLVLLAIAAASVSAQVSLDTQVAIIKAEDARDLDALKPYLNSKDVKVQERAVLAAGRIGDPRSVAGLAAILESGPPSVRPIAAFALGETESAQAAVFILRTLDEPNAPAPVRARAIEAAGKIAAEHPKDAAAVELGKWILIALEGENAQGAAADRETILLGLTALLRARPDGAAATAALFLSSKDARIRGDAANALARLRATNANKALRDILLFDRNDWVRVNAIRALAAAKDTEAFNPLLEAATGDKNPAIRIAAIQALAGLKDARAADRLLDRGEKLLAAYTKTKKPNFIPSEQNEFIEVASALGRILANTYDARADKLFADFGKLDKGHATEVYVARVRIGPRRAKPGEEKPQLTDWEQYRTLAQMMGEFADIDPKSDEGKQMKMEAPGILRPLVVAFVEADPATEGERMMAGPDTLQAYARFKTDDLAGIARTALKNKDVFMRAAAAGILADLPPSKENFDALANAWKKVGPSDPQYDDAQLAILEALVKIDKQRASGFLLIALASPDFLIRKRSFDIWNRDEMKDALRFITPTLDLAREKHKDRVLPYEPANGTKLGQLLNSDVDYRRAASRKNGGVRADLTTTKGTFTIELLPEDAPLTVDNFILLARKGYFNGLEVHRVVPNFVMQDGDPRGDGNGGPGWSIRCEINMIPYERGAVGMALSGKDTGGSQWFVTHSPQPHLDGGYTVFGRVNETGMKVVDNIVRGDKILSVKIVGR